MIVKAEVTRDNSPSCPDPRNCFISLARGLWTHIVESISCTLFSRQAAAISSAWLAFMAIGFS